MTALTTSSSLTGKVAIVTGGAGGIGAHICQRLAAAGARVVITYRADAVKAEKLLATLPGSGHFAAATSVTDSNAIAELVARVKRNCSRLDILVNNAGISKIVPHADVALLDDATIDAIFATNWRGAFAMTRACRDLLTASGDGLIINISSIAGTTALGSNIAYCASKDAMDNMTRALARALAPTIRVLSIAPGWVEGEYASRADPAYLQQQIARTPLGRIATPEDVADAVFSVCTTLRFTNGAIIPVDGGRPLN